MDTERPMCELCSTDEESVFLSKIESLDVCPKIDCYYGPEFQVLAHRVRNLGFNFNLTKLPEVIQKICSKHPIQVINSSPKNVSSPIKIALHDPSLDKSLSESDEYMDTTEVCIQSKSQNDVQLVLNVQENVSNVVDIVEIPVKDGICSEYRSFINWPNRDSFCWLNSTLALLVHSSHIKECIESKELSDCQVVNVFSEYESVLSEINKPTVSNAKMAEVSKQLHGIQEAVFKFVQHNLRYLKGQLNSPAQTLPFLLKENAEIKEMFEFNHDWKLNCENCSAVSYSQGIKTVVTVPEITEEFSMEQPWGLSTCKKCLTPDQKRKLTFERLPPVVIFHFEKGFIDQSIYNYDFDYQGRKYMIKGLILYADVFQRKHFVTYIRDLRSNKWLNCDDLQPGFHMFSPEMPKFKSSDIHMIMWERVNEHFNEETVIKTPLKCRSNVSTGDTSNRKIDEAFIHSRDFPVTPKGRLKQDSQATPSKSSGFAGSTPKVQSKKSVSLRRKRFPSNSEDTKNVPDISDGAEPNSVENSPIKLKCPNSEASPVLGNSKKSRCKMPRFPGIKHPTSQAAKGPAILSEDFKCKSIEDIEHFQQANQAKVVLEDCSGLKIIANTLVDKVSLKPKIQNSQGSSPSLEKALSAESNLSQVIPDFDSSLKKDLTVSIELDDTKIHVLEDSQLQESEKATSNIKISENSSSLVKTTSSREIKKKKSPVNKKRRINVSSTLNDPQKDVCTSISIKSSQKQASPSIEKSQESSMSNEESMHVNEKDKCVNVETCKIEIAETSTDDINSSHKNRKSSRKKQTVETPIFDAVSPSKFSDESLEKVANLSLSPSVRSSNNTDTKNSNSNNTRGRKRKLKQNVVIKEARPKRISSRCYDLRKDPKVSEKGKVKNKTMLKNPNFDWIEPPSEKSMSEEEVSSMSAKALTSKSGNVSKKKREKSVKTPSPAKSSETSKQRSGGKSPGSVKNSARKIRAGKKVSQVNACVDSEVLVSPNVQVNFGEKNSVTYTRCKNNESENDLSALKEKAESTTNSPNPFNNIKLTPNMQGLQGTPAFLSPRIIGMPGTPRFSLVSTRLPLNTGAIRMLGGSPFLRPGTRIQFKPGVGSTGPVFIIHPIAETKNVKDTELIPTTSAEQNQGNESSPSVNPLKNVLLVPATPSVDADMETSTTVPIFKEKKLLSGEKDLLTKNSETIQTTNPKGSTVVPTILLLTQETVTSKNVAIKNSGEVTKTENSPKKGKADNANSENASTESNVPSSNFPTLMHLGNGITLTPIATPSRTVKISSNLNVQTDISSDGSFISTPKLSNGNISKESGQQTKVTIKEIQPQTAALASTTQKNAANTTLTVKGQLSINPQEIVPDNVKLDERSTKQGNALNINEPWTIQNRSVENLEHKLSPNEKKMQSIVAISKTPNTKMRAAIKNFPIHIKSRNPEISKPTCTSLSNTRVSSRSLIREAKKVKDYFISPDESSEEDEFPPEKILVTSTSAPSLPLVTTIIPSTPLLETTLPSTKAVEDSKPSNTPSPKAAYACYEYSPSPLLSQLYKEDEDSDEM